jgi:hypothetical protein
MSNSDMTEFYRQHCRDARAAIVRGIETAPETLPCVCGNDMTYRTIWNDEVGTHYSFTCGTCQKTEIISTVF